MRTAVAMLLAVLPLAASAFKPYVTLTVAPKNVVVTESAEATIRIFMPNPFQHNPSITADFIPEGSRLTMERGQVSLGGTNAWRYTVKVPVKAETAGVRTLGPVVVSIPTRTDFFGFVARTADIRSGVARLEVVAPPENGRPRSFCGAISADFAAKASLDTNVCTAGDPLVFTLELSGVADASMVHAPSVDEAFRGSQFRLDGASLKTETLSASKRFTWRVRAIKAGTVEFPSVDVSWFDVRTREYRTIHTEPIPIQVKAGEQAVLGALDSVGGETDEYPLPDGIELPFEVTSFSLKHAVSLALRASTEDDFKKAAECYEAFLSAAENGGAADAPDGKAFKATHLANIGALYVMAGRPKEALAAYSRAELAAGSTAGTVRGMRAAFARIKNDPRAELPLPRVLFPFWFRLSLKGRIISAFAAMVGLVLLFMLALRAGRKLAVLAIASGMAASSFAWPFGRDPFAGIFDDMPRMGMGVGADACPIRAKAWFGTTKTMVGEPVDLVVSVDPGTVRIEPGSLKVEAAFPELTETGALRNDSPNVYKVRAMFLEPGTNSIGVAVTGSYSGTYCVTNGNMISSGRVMNQLFRIKLNPAMVTVAELPSAGRPIDFTGAVGRKFALTQTLTPNTVHPGDLVTAEYRLEFDGYCPSNAELRVENISREFKVYDVKEVSRTGNAVTWRQILVPRTTEAVNSALVSFSYYNLRNKRYEMARARPEKLTFVSSEAASTENTRVMVNDVSTGAGEAAAGPAVKSAARTLRFAPSDKSPIVVTLPPDVEVRETGRWQDWRRLESLRGAGWIRQ